VIKVLLRTTERDSYWWVECAGCEGGWQVPFYAQEGGVEGKSLRPNESARGWTAGGWGWGSDTSGPIRPYVVNWVSDPRPG
jgi:hypothetical protein